MKPAERRDDVRVLVEDCELRESRLTEWEASFIASIREQLDDGRKLSRKQNETLTNIWNKATERG